MEPLLLRVLITDDEDIIRLNLMAFLEDEGFIVRSASTGEEALKILENETLDAGIIDIRLPGMDGNSFIAEAHKLQPQMKFLIHTGSTNYTLPRSLVKIGISPDQVFIKPVSDMNVLVRAISRLIRS